MKKKSVAITSYALVGIMVAILGGLSGWYLYLRSETGTTQRADTARGFSSAIPSFNGTQGSTATNNGAGPDFPVPGPGGLAAAQGGGGAATTSIISYATPRLWHAEQAPAAGFGFVYTSTGLQLYYVERSTGYVFAADPRTGNTVRLTNTLRAKTQEASFDKNGGVIERSIGDDGSIITFSGSIASTTAQDGSPKILLGKTLEKNIVQLSGNALLASLFYLRRDTSGTTGLVAQWDGTKQKNVFSSPVGSWRPLLLDDGRTIVVQAASDNVSGYAYEIKKDGSWEEIAAGVGLTIAPRPFSTALLYGLSAGDSLSLFARPSAQATAVRLSIKTIADKCAWVPAPTNATPEKPGRLTAYCAVPLSTPRGGFLDAWYQGAVHTTDAWWTVDAGGGSAQLLYAPQSEGKGADVLDPVVDPTGTFIAYRDASDQSLWLFRINK